MGYSDREDMVRVDFFKPGGKWYCTEAVEWLDWSGTTSIHDAFKIALRNHFKDNNSKEPADRLSDMDAICLEPYHEHSHPIMLKAGEWVE